MVRLTRTQQQQRTRAAVLAAARAEFAQRGYGEARVDGIAERAELTRGAVYSNFPSKRALYLAVLLDAVDGATGPVAPGPPSGLAGAVGAFTRTWLDRLPLPGDTPAAGNLALRSLTGVFDDEPGRAALANLARLEAVLLGLALEACRPHRRRVRLAELVLTLLHGAGHLAETAPGFGDPFDVVRAAEHLAGLDLADAWDPPHLPFVEPARPVDEAWTPPADLPDLCTGRPVGLGADGVVAVLGTGRLDAAEEAVRAARPDDAVTIAVQTGDPAELGRLVRLRIGDLAGCLCRVFGPDHPDARPRLVLDEGGALAHALGVAATDDTEAAVRIRAGRIVARAGGRGAGHAAAGARG
ncbi:TetR/AcrR family transcriptional regulator [Actinophytocola sp.]|uniref:TetR/AcrR family transcriptional regulator n=1 Tax=Actinophytocola sp. TaxID=1872138 RepID=UPI002D7E3869|nr:TetR/AcrR family transcriptional regulator [Actinophytocola sp.]HET9140873.1 TetR/AcrR family transcriptional regulator [Actinophytocola sp.]